MPEIGSLTRSRPTAVSIDLGDDEKLALVFDMNRITPAWIREAEQRDSESDALSVSKALADVILEWDVTEGGEPFPPTAEHLAVLSYPAQRALLVQMLAAATPSDAEGNASSGTSSTPSTTFTVPQETHPNGPQPSTSLTPSAFPSTK